MSRCKIGSLRWPKHRRNGGFCFVDNLEQTPNEHHTSSNKHGPGHRCRNQARVSSTLLRWRGSWTQWWWWWVGIIGPSGRIAQGTASNRSKVDRWQFRHGLPCSTWGCCYQVIYQCSHNAVTAKHDYWAWAHCEACRKINLGWSSQGLRGVADYIHDIRSREVDSKVSKLGLNMSRTVTSPDLSPKPSGSLPCHQPHTFRSFRWFSTPSNDFCSFRRFPAPSNVFCSLPTLSHAFRRFLCVPTLLLHSRHIPGISA